jgi:hypothetical protein
MDPKTKMMQPRARTVAKELTKSPSKASWVRNEPIKDEPTTATKRIAVPRNSASDLRSRCVIGQL